MIMIRNALLIAFSFLFVGLATLLAQTSPASPSGDPQGPSEGDKSKEKPKPGDSAGPARFWQATLSGGQYMVALDQITSVSRHKYLLDGALVVDEVTVDTTGQALARFYFISPVTDALPGNTVANLASRATELLEKAAEHTGAEVQNMVVKKYPETTHARTIEYRILSEPELTSLYNSAQSAWESGKGRKFTGK
jgi:hypothetical protein